ncbi:MAG TPA: MMPL family transporter, partial [Pirellulaceae bacterium]
LGWCGKNLDAINSVLPALVLVIGVSDSIHLMLHVRAALRHGATSRAAAQSAVRACGPACLITALTTSMGFLSLLVTPDRIIRQLGIFGAVGVWMTLGAVLLLFPLLAGGPLGTACAAVRRRAGRYPPANWPDQWLAWLLFRKTRLLTISSIGFLVLGWTTLKTRADFNFLENLDGKSESFATMRHMEAVFGGLPLAQILVEETTPVSIPRDRGAIPPELLRVLAEVHEAVERNSILSAPTSLISLLASLPGEQTDLLSRVRELRLVPRTELRRLIQPEVGRAVVTANIPDSGAALLRPHLDALDRDLRRIEARHGEYRCAVSGFAVVSTYRTAPMIMNLVTGLSLELLVIFLVIAAALRSWRLGLASLPSNLFPLVATAATLVMVGDPLRYASALAFNICLGIAVDDTVHFFSRFRQELARTMDRGEALRCSFRDVAPAIVIQSVIMLSGFGTGLTSGIPTVRAFSACACGAILFALASELVLAPIMLACAMGVDARETMNIASTIPCTTSEGPSGSADSISPITSADVARSSVTS